MSHSGCSNTLLDIEDLANASLRPTKAFTKNKGKYPIQIHMDQHHPNRWIIHVFGINEIEAHPLCVELSFLTHKVKSISYKKDWMEEKVVFFLILINHSPSPSLVASAFQEACQTLAQKSKVCHTQFQSYFCNTKSEE